MNTRHHPSPSSVGQSKFITIYSRLLSGLGASDISPKEEPAQFYSSLFLLSVNRDYLEQELRKIPTHACLGPLKVALLISNREVKLTRESSRNL